MDLKRTFCGIQSVAVLMAGFLLVTVLCYSGCASSEQTRLRDRIQSMSDAELLNYYHGINERLKDIDGELQTDDQMDSDNQNDFIRNQTFFVGGEGHGLAQKRKIVMDEMYQRNITP